MRFRLPILFANDLAKSGTRAQLGIPDLFTYSIAITVQGSAAGASTVVVTLKDGAGVAVTAVDYLRVRICNNGVFTASTNATIAAGANTTLMETITANKDLVFKSHTDGTFTITLTDATPETVTLRIGQSILSARNGDTTPVQQVTHA